jgi:small conductance mechanosensitive channel
MRLIHAIPRRPIPGRGPLRLALLLAAVALLALAAVARAQEDDRAPVRVDGRTVFRIGPFEDLTAEERAQRVQQRITALLENPESIEPAVVETTDPDERAITVAGSTIVTVSAEDAEDNLMALDALADQWAEAINTALARAVESRQTGPLQIWSYIEGAFARLAESAATVLPRAVATILILILFGLIAAVVRAALKILFHAIIADPTLENLIGQVIYYSIWLLGIIIAINALGFDPEALATGIGLTSLALGFALRDILSNFISGMLILLLRPFELGDEIVIGEIEGAVERIDLRATKIRTYDGRLVLVPNADLFTSTVINNTAAPLRRGTVQLYLDYRVDLPRAVAVMKAAAEAVPEVLTKPPASVIVSELGQDDLVLEVRFWTASKRMAFLETTSDVGRALVQALKDAGIDLPDPDERFISPRPLDEWRSILGTEG